VALTHAAARRTRARTEGGNSAARSSVPGRECAARMKATMIGGDVELRVSVCLHVTNCAAGVHQARSPCRQGINLIISVNCCDHQWESGTEWYFPLPAHRTRTHGRALVRHADSPELAICAAHLLAGRHGAAGGAAGWLLQPLPLTQHCGGRTAHPTAARQGGVPGRGSTVCGSGRAACEEGEDARGAR
jgi:hypothetical protein